jgi:hypothetical protein
MKTLIFTTLIILSFFPVLTWGDFSRLEKVSAPNSSKSSLKPETPPKTKKRSPKTHSSLTGGEMDTLKQIKIQNQQLEALLKIKTSIPLVRDETFRFKTGDVLRGILLNSVVSTNLESPLLIRIHPDQGLPENSKLSCTGVTKHKRVITSCQLLITEFDEFPVSAIALNRDGSAGLKGEYYTGQEEYVAGAIASGFARGMMEVSQSRTLSRFGSEVQDTPKNKLLQGMINSSDVISTTLDEELKTKEPKVFIDAGQEVLVYFTAKFNSQIHENVDGVYP